MVFLFFPHPFRRLIRRASRVWGIALLSALAITVRSLAQVDSSAYVNFEGAQTNPVRLSPDGTRLFAVNTPDARLSVFDLSAPSSPRLIAEIPVGIEPVSVNPLSNDVAWVVNQVSDSVSIVSVSKGAVVDTLYIKDEPADVVFVGGLGFVTASRNHEVRVFEIASRALVKSIPLTGESPRALATNGAGTKVYTAFALSGNGTTVVPLASAPPQPPPTNPSLPPAPPAALIVDIRDPRWADVLKFRLPDYDVAEIDVATLGVTKYVSGVGTINLGLAVNPLNDDVFVANTDALNLVRFEPTLRGRFVRNRLTRITPTGLVRAFDLNAGVDESIATALAQPTAMVFDPFGGFMYVAAFGTDRVGVIDTDGNVLNRIEIGPVGASAIDPANKRGPRGLALNAATSRLYVLNRISNTISIVDTAAEAQIGEIPVGSFDPTTAAVRHGRGFLYDAKLSGNGTASCASCHIDADMDLLAWDLGDPGGEMQTVEQGRNVFEMHPMKGPKTTQTLRGLKDTEPLHWRGDRADFAAFNQAFDTLMGSSPLSTTDMESYTDFIQTIAYQPNPHQNLDRTLPAELFGGDPRAGRETFLTETFFDSLPLTCNRCHTSDPGPGTNRKITVRETVGQPLKTPHLRNVYQKVGFTNRAGATSISGVGYTSSGELNIMQVLLRVPFGIIAVDPVRRRNVASFLMCFDTGTAPAVGYTRTVTWSGVGAVLGDWNILEAQAADGHIDLIVKGTLDGAVRGFLYQPASGSYLPDTSTSLPLLRAQLLLSLRSGGVLSIMGVPPGSGRRMGIDRDLDGVLDGEDVVGPVQALP